MRSSLVILLLLTSIVSAAPPTLTLPDTMKGDPGTFISIPATTSGKVVKWVVMDPGLNLFPVDLLKDTHTAVVVGSTPGSYRIMAITCAGDELSNPVICTVVVNGPPAPPIPPFPPTPTDPLYGILQPLYQSDTSAMKSSVASTLASLFRTAVGTVDDPSITTLGQLGLVMSKAASTLLGSDTTTLGALRKQLQTELSKLGTATTPLTPDLRGQVKVLFTRIATVLEALAKTRSPAKVKA